ncbi:hypothetical protein B7P43_G10305 [Cryptotermes secundus]|uniref:Uncharacterized protein n=1 Tax=Cryptotermes secundus TaxID=105785 RepID=A0A2J7PJB0_9NEOP|nr:hypothetical protein B7P43_G10305 [Cryptotermes secundus]
MIPINMCESFGWDRCLIWSIHVVLKAISSPEATHITSKVREYRCENMHKTKCGLNLYLNQRKSKALWATISVPRTTSVK